MPNMYIVSTGVQTAQGQPVAQGTLSASRHPGDVCKWIAPGTRLSILVDAIIADLQRASAPQNSFEGLFLLAHGSPGQIALGDGLTQHNVSDLNRLAPYFARTQSCPQIRQGQALTPGQVVSPSSWGYCVIKGCAVASAARPVSVPGWPTAPGTLCSSTGSGDTSVRMGAGFNFLLSLAQILGIQVSGCVDEQPYNRYLPSTDWNLNGPVLTVFPNQQYVLGSVNANSWFPMPPPPCPAQGTQEFYRARMR